MTTSFDHCAYHDMRCEDRFKIDNLYIQNKLYVAYILEYSISSLIFVLKNDQMERLVEDEKFLVNMACLNNVDRLQNTLIKDRSVILARTAAAYSYKSLKEMFGNKHGDIFDHHYILNLHDYSHATRHVIDNNIIENMKNILHDQGIDANIIAYNDLCPYESHTVYDTGIPIFDTMFMFHTYYLFDTIIPQEVKILLKLGLHTR